MVRVVEASKKEEAVPAYPSSVLQGFRPNLHHAGYPVPPPPPFNTAKRQRISIPSLPSNGIPTAIPLPSPIPTTTEGPEENTISDSRHDSSHSTSDRTASRHDMMTAFLPLIAALVISPIAGLVFFLMHRAYKKKEFENLKRSLSQKLPLHFESSRETSISSSFSGESRGSQIDFFNHLKYSKKNASLCNRYEGSDFISSPFSVRENGSDRWEFPRKNLRFSRILGEGNFGQVWMCDVVDLCGGQETETVAVKMLKQIHTDKEKRDLLSELAIMKMLGPHPNVVSLLGCCSEQEPIYLILEHMPNGKLQTYLKSCRPQPGYSALLSSQDLTSFAYQVAKGMEYISSKGVSIQAK